MKIIRCQILVNRGKARQLLTTTASVYGRFLPAEHFRMSFFTDIAIYGVFCLVNMLFYYLTFYITGLPNFW